MSKLKPISVYIQEIRLILNLKNTIFEDMPDELVLIPFVTRRASSRLSQETRKWLKDTVGSINYEEYEFVGDTIINLIARVSIFDPETYSNSLMNKFYVSLSRNMAFTCMMRYNKPELITIANELAGYPVSDDDIADMLEALMAALYDYLSLQMGYKAIEYVHQYLRDEFLWDLYITRVLNNLNDPICGLSPTPKQPAIKRLVSNISPWSVACDALNRNLRTITYNDGTSSIEYKNCPSKRTSPTRMKFVEVTPQIINTSVWSTECDELNRRQRIVTMSDNSTRIEYRPCAIERFLTPKELNTMTSDQIKDAIIQKLQDISIAEEVKQDLLQRTLNATSKAKLKDIYTDIFKIAQI